MQFYNVKRRSKPKFIAAVVLAVLVFLIASPFVLVGDSVLDVQLKQNSAQAFNFSKSLDAIADAAGMEGSRDLPSIVGGIIYAALGLVGVVFLVLVIIAGVKWMTAEGNEEIVNQAKGTLKHAAIGILVVLGAYAITYFVINAVL